MNSRRIVIGTIWAVVLVGATAEGLTLPHLEHTANWRLNSSFGALAVVLPALFFSTMGLWISGNPFDVPHIRAWVNSQFGDRVYESFISALRPLLLFALGAAVIGGVGIASLTRAHASEGRFVGPAFFISMSVGLFVLRAILRRRGVALE